MSMTEPQSAASKPPHRWYRLTPDRCLAVLLAFEGGLLLSDRFGWPVWHKGYAVLTAMASVGAFLLLMLGWLALAMVFRRRFQFSIRSLLVLIVAVAVPCSWFSCEMKKARQQREAVQGIVTLGGGVVSDYERSFFSTQQAPAWLRQLFGDDFFRDVVGVYLDEPRVKDADLEYVEGLARLQELRLYNSQITDAGIRRLRGLTQLFCLTLDNTRITDTALDQLKGLPRLGLLSLTNTAITDTGLEHLKSLTEIAHLSLDGTQITDVGLKYVAGFTHLWHLDLRQVRVTDAGLKHIVGLSRLIELSLDGTPVTDRGLEDLKGLRLRGLSLEGTRASAHSA